MTVNGQRRTWQSSAVVAAAWLYVLSGPTLADAAAACWSGAFSQADYPHCQQLAPIYALHWRIHNGTITFAVAINPAPKWFGLGLSEAGGMKGADIMLVQSSPNDTAAWTVTDMFSTDYTHPSPDAQQDVILNSATLSNSTLTAVLTRPLTTCDDSDWPIALDNSIQHVIWSMGNSSGLAYHGPSNRGSIIVVFDPDPSVAAPADPSDAVPLEIFMPNYIIPTNVTTDYRCVIADVPAGPKRHLFRFESTVASRLVHHMILYGCTKQPPYDVGSTINCANMPANCQTFMVSWVPGAADFAFPKEAAFAVGGTGINWFALQVHYNNPRQLSVPPDSSGFTIYLTKQLRKYDAAVLWLGSEQISIPAGSSSYSVTPNICSEICTSQFAASLTVINTFPHMHEVGKTLVTRHIRGGQELPPLSVRQHWDFNFQQKVAPPVGTQILPGDTLITTCTYNASERTTMTEYGEGSSDEMCYDFVLYYPAQPAIDKCMSYVASTGKFGVCATLDEIDKMSGVDTPEEIAELFLFGKLVTLQSIKFTGYDPVCQPTADVAALRRAITDAAVTTTPASAPRSIPSAAAIPKGSGAQPRYNSQSSFGWLALLCVALLAMACGC